MISWHSQFLFSYQIVFRHLVKSSRNRKIPPGWSELMLNFNLFKRTECTDERFYWQLHVHSYTVVAKKKIKSIHVCGSIRLRVVRLLFCYVYFALKNLVLYVKRISKHFGGVNLMEQYVGSVCWIKWTVHRKIPWTWKNFYDIDNLTVHKCMLYLAL